MAVEKPTQADLHETNVQRQLRLLAARVETLEIPPELQVVTEEIRRILDEAASRIETLDRMIRCIESYEEIINDRRV